MPFFQWEISEGYGPDPVRKVSDPHHWVKATYDYSYLCYNLTAIYIKIITLFTMSNLILCVNNWYA